MHKIGGHRIEELAPTSHPRPVSSPATPSPRTSHDVTRLLHALQQGEEGAADRLIPLVYAELHDLAAHYMRGERDGHTLQPTALVNEAYLRLVDSRGSSWQDRAHFYGVAAQAMRRILVDHARRKGAAKREGGQRVTLEEAGLGTEGDASSRALDLVALDLALEKLATIEGRYARVVELRFFGGLEIEQIAEVMGTSPATVKRDWTFAKAFLQRELDG